MTTSFTISTSRVARSWWIVRIHPDLDNLRRAAHRYRPQHGLTWWSECYACCQPVHSKPGGFGGILRFGQDHLYLEVLAHEVAHAAAATYRANIDPELNLGAECSDREEDLAYIYGELLADLTGKLE